MAPPLKVAVIGAGVSGLTAARALKAEGLRVTVYEKSDQVGGAWVYDPRVESDPLSLDPNREIVHSSIYASLRTNLPRQLMGFSDYPFSSRKNGDSRTFPGHQEVADFLKEFADFFGLVELIKFNTEVVQVERIGPDWIVQSRFSDSGWVSEEIFDAVVVCNGHYTQSRLAQIPGIEKWPGKQIHSHNYRSPEPFQDKIVVVIGNGPSAIDISAEISEVAKQVHLSSRAPDTKIYKLEEFGDNIWQHSEVDSVNEHGVVSFQEGACLKVDIIIHCTGYNFAFPFLKSNRIVSVDDNRVGPLYKHIFPPKLAPSLSFIGLSYRALVNLMVDLQAKWVARVLSGNASLPSEEEMQADVERYYQLMEEKGVPKHQTHAISLEMFDDYLDWIAAQAGLEPVDEEIKLTTNTYFIFLRDNTLWRAKEWEPHGAFQQGDW